MVVAGFNGPHLMSLEIIFLSENVFTKNDSSFDFIGVFLKRIDRLSFSYKN